MGELLASGGIEGTISGWEADSGRELLVFQGHEDEVLESRRQAPSLQGQRQKDYHLGHFAVKQRPILVSQWANRPTAGHFAESWCGHGVL